ncbi:hypothetical protein [Acidihalobacter ferrooxydans]|uniref:Uncharacterized protein n=1 Tax=Acidihalobacter ferrooxydans TaxID=1765967 RepID=A0A1P8UGR9_9GAMM|nr:hypothetical protein [Acidihalobacter ferrooxydans]APZ42971.1 hypothetical protein BW247_07585 [Acidihalobacter ferrooxydans]
MKQSEFLREVRTFDLIARRLWPLLRPLARPHLRPRCRVCAIPAAYAPLDAAGVCAACREHETERKSGESDAASPDQALAHEVDEKLKVAQGQGRIYDAVLLFSGGKDSCYLLHRLQQDYPDLRLIALLVDNGFMSPVALENAEAAIAAFEIDHLVFKPNPAFVRKLFRLAFGEIPRQRGYSIVDMMDGQLTFDSARNLAAHLGAPLVVCGLGRTQVSNIFGGVRVEMSEEDARNPLAARQGLTLEELFSAEEMRHWYRAEMWPEQARPRVLMPMVAWDPPEQEIIAQLETLGLMRPGQSNPLLTNNAFIPVIALSEVAHFGFNSFEVEFSRLIREGRIEPGYWRNLFEMVEYSARTGRFVGRGTLEVLERLKMSRQDIGLD